MKPVASNIIVYSAFLLIISGCTTQKICTTPKPSLYAKTPQVKYINGYPKQKQLWIVYADRNKCPVNRTQTDALFTAYTNAGFLEPLVVLKNKGDLMRVAKYSPEQAGKTKFSTKNGKILGWVSKEKLLLWNGALKDYPSGFSVKAALVINDSNVIQHPEKYMDKDSVFVFDAPNFTDKGNIKLPIGQIVYVYKNSGDGEWSLIGASPGITADSIKNEIYGWVHKNVIAEWGNRQAVKINNVYPDSAAVIGIDKIKNNNPVPYPVLYGTDLKNRTSFTNIYPVNNFDITDTVPQKTKFFTNVLDYSKNKIYNVLGNPIYFNKYKKIISDDKKLNIVFVMDISRNNRLYIPLVRSLLQELQLKFSSSPYFNEIKFGGVIYKDNSCNGIRSLASPLSPDYTKAAAFITDGKADSALNCNDNNIAQPVGDGILSATKILGKAADETNIIIVIGAAAGNAQNGQNVVSAVTKVKARLIFFQTQSKPADEYNDFVLFAQNTVLSTAQNIAELKKEKIVNQNDVLAANTYNLESGNDGIYFLNYPQQSMTQGFVLFPKKGDVMQSSYLKSAIDTMMAQVVADNKHIDSSLGSYFHSEIGMGNTALPAYTDVSGSISGKVPAKIAAALPDDDSPFLLDGFIVSGLPAGSLESGILLSEQEYDQLTDYYGRIARATLMQNNNFHPSRALRKYTRLVAKNNPAAVHIRRRALYDKNMAYAIKLVTGFVATDSLSTVPSIRWWKKTLPSPALENYFEQYEQLSEKMISGKGSDSIRIRDNGQYFYWLNKDFIPVIKTNQDNNISNN